MKIQLIIEVRPLEQVSEPGKSNESYKNCPQCGQCKFPFRYGRCFICKKQVSDIPYQIQSRQNTPTDRENVKMGIKEVYQGLDEMEVPN